jgi:hypothetical protein
MLPSTPLGIKQCDPTELASVARGLLHYGHHEFEGRGS